MDSDQGKLFIGGISWETTEDKLTEHFGKYGDVLQTAVMRDKTTGRPRGFGFVVFADPSVLDTVLQDTHTIDGRTVEAKRALSREEQQSNPKPVNSNSSRSSSGGGASSGVRTKKIFVGGLPPTVTEDSFRQYFEAYGLVTDVVIMYDQTTQRPRGFGFVSFDSEDSVDSVLHKTFHDLNGKQVEVKRALPKDANPGGGNRSMGGGGGYQSYGTSGGNSSSYDGRMDSNRYMQPQSAGSGFPPYGASGYSTPGYAYGAGSNGVGFGGYGGYGSAGYGATGGAAYGNPNVPNAGYSSGPPGAPRTSWNNQSPSGYGSMGYGGAVSWNAGSGAATGGPGSTQTGQTQSGPGGYNQGYGYGSYVSNDGCGAGRSGSTPGEVQGNSGGYAGGGYGDANGNGGYDNAAWRSESSQGSGNYATQANGGHTSQVAYGGGGY
ncbi:Heterogeneous nuclear ribonucleoprotein 1 [Linum perenne]